MYSVTFGRGQWTNGIPIVTSDAIIRRAPANTRGRHGWRRELLRAAGSLALAPAWSFLPGCATVSSGPDRDRTYAPLLFECRHPARATMHLFGSLHVGLPEFYPLPPAIQTAFEEAACLAVEIDARRHWHDLVAAFRPHVYLADGLTLADLVEPTLLAQIREHFGFAADTWRELLRMQPWWVANFRFDTEHDRRSRVSLDMGTERHLLEAARRSGKPVIELETVHEQVTGLATGTMAEQLLQLRGWFDAVRRRGGLLGDLLAAWRLGDVDGLAALKDELWGTPQWLQSLRSRFFTERDRRMAVRMDELAANGVPVFVAIGAYHLAGNDSLLRHLLDLGYQVDRINTQARRGGESAAKGSSKTAFI